MAKQIHRDFDDTHADDRDSASFRDFAAEIGKSVRKLKSATIREIKEDLVKRKVVIIDRWFMCALERLESVGYLHLDTKHAQYTRYVYGAAADRKPFALPKLNFVGVAVNQRL